MNPPPKQMEELKKWLYLSLLKIISETIIAKKINKVFRDFLSLSKWKVFLHSYICNLTCTPPFCLGFLLDLLFGLLF